MPQYGYTTAGGEEISPFIDMINGGGPGRSGERFEGGGIMSLLANLVASPYGSQRQRPGHPAPGTMGVSRDASGGGFQSQLPGEDLMGGMGDEGGTGGAGFDPSYYSDLIPLSEEEYALLVSMPDRLVPPSLGSALPGDPVPRSVLLELRGALLGDTDMRQTTPESTADPGMVPVTQEMLDFLLGLSPFDIPDAFQDVAVGDLVPASALSELGYGEPLTPTRMMPSENSMETRASLAQYSPRSPVPSTSPSISELTGAGLGQGMASPMATDEGLGLIGDQTYSGRPDDYTMASESFPMPTQDRDIYDTTAIHVMMGILRPLNPTATEEELQDMAIRELVTSR